MYTKTQEIIWVVRKIVIVSICFILIIILILSGNPNIMMLPFQPFWRVWFKILTFPRDFLAWEGCSHKIININNNNSINNNKKKVWILKFTSTVYVLKKKQSLRNLERQPFSSDNWTHFGPYLGTRELWSIVVVETFCILLGNKFTIIYFLSFSMTRTNETINNKQNTENIFHTCVSKRKKDFVFFFSYTYSTFLKIN